MDDELARCDREIAHTYTEAYAGNPDIDGMMLGLHDWRTEKKLIANERTMRPNLSQQPEFKHGEKCNGRELPLL